MRRLTIVLSYYNQSDALKQHIGYWVNYHEEIRNIVTHLPNVRYLTGFTGSSGMAVVLREETILLSDFRYRTQAELEVGPAARVEIVAADLWKRLKMTQIPVTN